MGEDVTKVRLVAEPAFQADLRQGQVGLPDQLLGPGDALATDPGLRGLAGAAFECSGKMTAGQGAGLGQFGDFQRVAKAVENHFLDQAFAPGDRPPVPVLRVGLMAALTVVCDARAMTKTPCQWEMPGAPYGGRPASRLRKQVWAEGFILGCEARACELNVVNCVQVQHRTQYSLSTCLQVLRCETSA